MAKIQLAYPVSAISGRVGNIVYVKTKKEMVDDSILRSNVYIRKYTKTKMNDIRHKNIQIAFSIVVKKWDELKITKEQLKSWQDRAKQLESSLGRSVSTYLLFLTYFMTAYTSKLGTNVKPTGLTSGSSLKYKDRKTMRWL